MLVSDEGVHRPGLFLAGLFLAGFFLTGLFFLTRFPLRGLLTGIALGGSFLLSRVILGGVILLGRFFPLHGFAGLIPGGFAGLSLLLSERAGGRALQLLPLFLCRGSRTLRAGRGRGHIPLRRQGGQGQGCAEQQG